MCALHSLRAPPDVLAHRVQACHTAGTALAALLQAMLHHFAHHAANAHDTDRQWTQHLQAVLQRELALLPAGA
jgi:hypothetical protein